MEIENLSAVVDRASEKMRRVHNTAAWNLSGKQKQKKTKTK